MIKFHEVTWYSKLAAAIVTFAVLPVLSFYIGVKYEEVKGSSNTISSFVTSTPQIKKSTEIKAAALNTTIKIPFSFEDFFSGEKSTLTTIKTSYGTLSFSLLMDEEHFRSRNPSYGVLLNDQKIGEISGQGFTAPSFSPDKRYYVFRGRGVTGCAGTCQNFSLYIVDLKEKKVSYIQYPKNAAKYHGNGTLTSDNNYIESYSWKDNTTISMTTFLVLNDKDQMYRASPKQVWDYNINTNEYTLTSEN